MKNMKTLWNHLKKFFDTTNTCTGNCNQGRNCDCKMLSFSDAIIEVHSLASKVPDVDMGVELRQIADRLARLGNIYHERYYGQEPPKENLEISKS